MIVSDMNQLKYVEIPMYSIKFIKIHLNTIKLIIILKDLLKN